MLVFMLVYFLLPLPYYHAFSIYVHLYFFSRKFRAHCLFEHLLGECLPPKGHYYEIIDLRYLFSKSLKSISSVLPSLVSNVRTVSKSYLSFIGWKLHLHEAYVTYVNVIIHIFLSRTGGVVNTNTLKGRMFCEQKIFRFFASSSLFRESYCQIR